MKNLLVIAFAICSCILTNAQQATSPKSADVILYDGKIFTSDRASLWVDAIAIKGSRISAVGRRDDVMKQKDAHTKVIDLQGRLVVPGFNDAHAHVGGDYPARQINLVENPADPTPWVLVRDSLTKVVNEVPPGKLIQCTINPDLFEDISVRRPALDSIAPQNPIILSAWSGHGAIANTPALALLGLHEKSLFAGGRLEKDNHGRLTGYLEEYACFRTTSKLLEKIPTETIVADIKSYHHYTASLGLTTMQNMCTAFGAAKAQEVYASPDFTCRTRLIAFPFPDQDELQLKDWKPFFRLHNAMTYGSGIKMVLDGTPLERFACLRATYRDKSTHGRLNFSAEEVKKFMTFALENKQQIIIHAVGDSTVATVINAMRDLRPDEFWRGKRLRLEHADIGIVTKEDLQNLKQLGIVIVQNPLHLALPDIMTQRLDSSRLHYLQAMRSLLDNNIPFAIGSDGPSNPFVNLMFALIHPDNPKEAITLEEAMIAYTQGSAYAEFTEKEKGTLTPGKVADLAVLSQNIFEISPQQMLATESILTFLDGKVVHDTKILK